MLKKIEPTHDHPFLRLADASSPTPFYAGLEYSSPARGSWNIVHIGMLVPESHQIYVCAAGCIRGVVLTAAEMGAMDRFSTIALREQDIFEGNIEELMVEGISDILHRLPKRPPAVLVFTSCLHHFLGCDMPFVYQELRQRFPSVDFANCTMNPIMQKNGITPEQSCRREMFHLLKKKPLAARTLNLLGNDLPLRGNNELIQLIQQAHWTWNDSANCSSYADFQEMSKAVLNLYYQPSATLAVKLLKDTLQQEFLYLPLSYDYNEIQENLLRLANTLGLPLPSYKKQITCCETALEKLHELLGQVPIAIDATATFRPFSLARLLFTHGFHIVRIYADTISPEDQPDFNFLRAAAPEVQLYPTNQPIMRCLPRHMEKKWLAIGQKAAYFTGTSYFVNIIENGGFYGFDGILQLIRLMREAFFTPKNARQIIQQKGWGCTCCL